MINTRWTAVWVLYWARIHGKTSQTNRTVDGLWLKTQHGAKRPRRAATLELVSRNTEATAARSEPLSSFIAPSCSWISLHMQRHRRETWCVQGPPLQLVHCKTAVHFSQMSWLLVELFGILCVIFISVSIALPRVYIFLSNQTQQRLTSLVRLLSLRGKTRLYELKHTKHKSEGIIVCLLCCLVVLCYHSIAKRCDNWCLNKKKSWNTKSLTWRCSNSS